MIIDIHAHLDRDPISKTYLISEQFEDMEKNKITKRVISTLQNWLIYILINLLVVQ